MTALRITGWSMGLAGLAGGVFWLAGEITPIQLTEVTSATNQALVPPSTAPGLSTPAVIGPPTTAQEERLHRLEVQVQTLTQQLHNLQQLTNRSRSELAMLGQNVTPGQAVGSDDAALSQEPPSPETEKAAVLARKAMLDQYLATEKVDRHWSGSATAQIRAVFADGKLAGSTLLNAACQATLCRLEVEHRDEAAQDRFLDVFPGQLGWNGYSYSQITSHGDGSSTLVLYLVREGYSLPNPGA